MYFIDPHIHIASRTTNELERMARAGCLAVGEPAFWMGYDRSGAGSFYDYFRQLTEWEPKRTANYGIRHYAWMGLNSKEAENVPLAREVIALLPEFLDRPDVLGVGEIGLNKCTKKRDHHALGVDRPGPEARRATPLPHAAPRRQILGHADDPRHPAGGPPRRPQPRLDRPLRGTHHSQVLDEGYWAGMTLYPTTKATPERAADMVEIYGPERILVTSSADRGPSDPLAVTAFIHVMRRRGHGESLIRRIVYENPLRLMGQSRGFTPPAPAEGSTVGVDVDPGTATRWGMFSASGLG